MARSESHVMTRSRTSKQDSNSLRELGTHLSDEETCTRRLAREARRPVPTGEGTTAPEPAGTTFRKAISARCALPEAARPSESRLKSLEAPFKVCKPAHCTVPEAARPYVPRLESLEAPFKERALDPAKKGEGLRRRGCCVLLWL